MKVYISYYFLPEKMPVKVEEAWLPESYDVYKTLSDEILHALNQEQKDLIVQNRLKGSIRLAELNQRRNHRVEGASTICWESLKTRYYVEMQSLEELTAFVTKWFDEATALLTIESGRLCISEHATEYPD